MPPKKEKMKNDVKIDNGASHRDKRDRNNEAVRKSRQKTKKLAEERKLRMEHLRQENEALENRIKILAKELEVLQKAFTNFHQSLKLETMEIQVLTMA